MGFSKKLSNLLKLHGEDPDEVAWFAALDRHIELRNAMIHHRPGWVVDESDEHSVEPSEDMTQELLAETHEVVHGAVDGLFALYGVPTPETHRPDWLRDAADW